MSYICRVIKTKKIMQATIIILLTVIICVIFWIYKFAKIIAMNQKHIHGMLIEIKDELKNKQQ